MNYMIFVLLLLLILNEVRKESKFYAKILSIVFALGLIGDGFMKIHEINKRQKHEITRIQEIIEDLNNAISEKETAAKEEEPILEVAYIPKMVKIEKTMAVNETVLVNSQNLIGLQISLKNLEKNKNETGTIISEKEGLITVECQKKKYKLMISKINNKKNILMKKTFADMEIGMLKFRLESEKTTLKLLTKNDE